MKYSFENLALSGGGVWGIAYLGMLEELEQAGALAQIQRVVGSSAGAISSMLISFRLSAAKTGAVRLLDYSKIPQKWLIRPRRNYRPRTRPSRPSWPCNRTRTTSRLKTSSACCACSTRRLVFQRLLLPLAENVVASQFKDGRPDKIHLRRLRQAGAAQNDQPFRQLHVIGCDAKAHQARIFSAELTPDVEVAEAVRISMSIPSSSKRKTSATPASQPAYSSTAAPSGTTRSTSSTTSTQQSPSREKIKRRRKPSAPISTRRRASRHRTPT